MSKIPTKKRIQELSQKWMNGTLSEQEKQEYDLWYSAFNDHEISDLTEEDFLSAKEAIYQSIVEKESLSPRLHLPRKKRKMRIAFAACLTLFILFGSVLYFSQVTKRDNDQKVAVVIEPGRNQATLSLDNGTVFDLDSLKAGKVLHENGVKVEKTKEGELIYSTAAAAPEDEKEILMNTVSTPRGGQYKVQLPDGSRVWLNAASSLTFPSRFTKESRTVELAGEAYFEVTRNEDIPFRVRTKKETIEVLGTHFNVNSYADEPASITTLVEGKVKVSLPNAVSQILRPGQQSLVRTGDDIQVNEVDPFEIVAWKDGDFMFNNEALERAMRKVERWYNVEFVYEDNIGNVPIWGSVSRYEKIEEVLKVVELTEAAHFKIEGRRVYVMR